MRLLFVCSGNICRSAMASAYARARLADAGRTDVLVESAGTLGIEGERAAPEAIQVLREEGIDLGGHRSRGLREADIRGADLVVVMTLAHAETIERSLPAVSADLRLLRAFENGPEPRAGASDLEDPIGLPIGSYRECFSRIRSCVDHLLEHLRARS